MTKSAPPTAGAAEDTPLGQLVETSSPVQSDGPTVRNVNERDYLCIRVHNRALAFPVDRVTEVVPPGTITPVPHTPAYIPGILNRHGRVTAVLDLGHFLGDGSEANPKRIVVLQAGDLEAGIPVSDVLGIHTWDDAQLRPPMPSMMDLGAFVSAHVLVEEVSFIVIDVAGLLAATKAQDNAEEE